MVYRLSAIATSAHPRRLVDVDFVRDVCGKWELLNLRNTSPDRLDFYVGHGGGRLYVEIDLWEGLLNWYADDVAKSFFLDRARPNVVVSWTASGRDSDLSLIVEISETLIDDPAFVIYDDEGGVRNSW